jgi:hypothetical protein
VDETFFTPRCIIRPQKRDALFLLFRLNRSNFVFRPDWVVPAVTRVGFQTPTLTKVE